MLSVVASNPIVAVDGESLALAGNARAIWHEGIGLVALSEYPASTYPGELYAVQLDGKAVRLGGQRATGAHSWGGFGWGVATSEDASERFVAARAAVGWQRMILPATMPTGELHAGSSSAQYSFAILPDRAIRYAVGRIDVSGWETVSATIEATLDTGGGTGAFGALAPADLSAGRSRWWAIDLPTGRVRLYDAIAKAEIAGYRTRLDDALDLASYSRKHDLFVAVKAGSLLVYAHEPVAATVEAPTVSAPIRAGSIRTVSARLLGADGEPCADRVITFTATAGAFERASTATDAAGTASAIYCAPFEGVSAVTVTATLAE